MPVMKCHVAELALISALDASRNQPDRSRLAEGVSEHYGNQGRRRGEQEQESGGDET